MSDKKPLELEQLKAKSPFEIKQYIDAVQARKAELEELKGTKDWSEDLQDELNEIALFLVDAEDIYEEALDREKEKGPKYKVAAGEENLVHAKIVHGRRFNPTTGKEESKPYIQKFTPSEWHVFYGNYRLNGYTIVEILHKPLKS